jgi:hypothetical protein
MKFMPLILLLLVACEAKVQVASGPASHAPTVQATPVSQFGHISPIQLPSGEYFSGWVVTSASQPGGPGSAYTPERKYFSTTSTPPNGPHGLGTHTLRDSGGTPILIVIDPKL